MTNVKLSDGAAKMKVLILLSIAAEFAEINQLQQAKANVYNETRKSTALVKAGTKRKYKHTMQVLACCKRNPLSQSHVQPGFNIFTTGDAVLDSETMMTALTLFVPADRQLYAGLFRECGDSTTSSRGNFSSDK